MKIRRKLIIGFLLIGFFSLAVGAMGLVNMDKANTSTLNLYEQEMMPSSYLQDSAKKPDFNRVQLCIDALRAKCIKSAAASQ